MNQRVIVIVLLALFTTCFVSSGAIITLKVIGSMVSSARTDTPPQADEPPEEPRESQPPVADPLEDDPTASVSPQVVPEPDPEEPDPEEAVPEVEDVPFEPPLLGMAQFAVFHMDKAKLPPLTALQKAAKGTSVKVFEDEASPSALPPYMEVQDLSTQDYAVIGGTTLANGRGLSDAVKKSLPKAQRVSVVNVYMPLGAQPLLESSKVMLAFAHTTGGVLWDEETNEYLSAEEWKKRRVDSWEKTVPNISLNVRLYEDPRDDGAVNLRTGGMKHFGLPELVLEAVSKDVKGEAASMLYATAQTLAERKGPVMEGALEVSIPKLKHAGFRKELLGLAAKNAERSIDVELVGGDGSKLPTMQVLLPEGGDPDQRVEAALDTFFGFEE